MHRLVGMLILAAAVAAAIPAGAETPMSPIYPTGPRKAQPAAPAASLAGTAAPAGAKPAASVKSAPGSAPAGIENLSGKPVATAAIPPLPAETAPEAAAPVSATSAETAAAPPPRRPRWHYARQRSPVYYGHPPTYAGAYPAAGAYGPSPNSSAGP